MKDTIPIPKAWLERLISLSDAILTTSQTIGDEGKERLKGYIESAKTLLEDYNLEYYLECKHMDKYLESRIRLFTKSQTKKYEKTNRP